MIFRLQQFLESVDLSFLFLDFRIGCSVGRPSRCHAACISACRVRAPSRPRRTTGADGHRLHSGWTVKRGATSHPAWNAASALSNVWVCPQQRHVYVGMVPVPASIESDRTLGFLLYEDVP